MLLQVLTYEWALPMLEKFYDRVTFPGDKWHKISRLWPDGSTSFTMKMFLDSNYNKYVQRNQILVNMWYITYG